MFISILSDVNTFYQVAVMVLISFVMIFEEQINNKPSFLWADSQQDAAELNQQVGENIMLKKKKSAGQSV